MIHNVTLPHPVLGVDGPVDDVEEDVGTGKDNPGVLVNSVGVDPNVHVASGRLHLPCDLRVVQSHLSQHLLLTSAVFWNPVISRAVNIDGAIAGDLAVDHHLVWIADATGARQLVGERTQSSLLDVMEHGQD